MPDIETPPSQLADRSLDERLPASASSHVKHFLELRVHSLEKYGSESDITIQYVEEIYSFNVSKLHLISPIKTFAHSRISSALR